jgi:hypothetical protein
MMDITMASLARSEYEERLHKAELERRLIRKAGAQPRMVDTLLLRLSQWLINAGESLRHRVELRPTLH